MTAYARELLAASTRRGRDPLDEDDELAAARPRARTPGKQRADEDGAGMPPRDPGKRSRAADGTAAMSPGHALAFADWMTRAGRIDRRTEAELDDEGGALSAAFQFLAEARGGQPLPDELRRRLAAELGVDLSPVRVHTDEHAARSAAALGARAFTIGDDIYFAAGAYDPSSAAGVELIAHEVAHVAQQRGAPSSRPSGRVSRPGDAHEREADAFATRFARDDRGDRGDRGADPARWINELRRRGGRVPLPMREELEAHFGTSLDFVEVYAGEAARLACQLLQASAFAVRNVVAFADPSPQRDALLHELAHVVQTGGRTAIAPDRFRPATLAVSTPSAEAEADARAVARGAAVTATASPDVIHRRGPGDDDDDPPWTLDDAKDAFVTKFLPNVPQRADSDPYSFAAKGAGNDAFLLLFAKSSRHMFQLAKYQAAIGHTTPEQKQKSAEDLQKLHARHWQTIGLVRPEIDNPSSTSWAYVDPSEPITQQVLYLLLEERQNPDPEAMWTTYCNVVQKLHGKGSILGFQQVDLGGRQYPVNNRQRTAYREAEYKALEDQLVEAIVAEPKYQWRQRSYWRTFYKEVCEEPPLLPQAAQGRAFKELVKAYRGDFAEGEAMFLHDDLTSGSTRRFADGFSLSGEAILLECKSGTTPQDKFIAQAGDYARIVRATDPIPAYSPPDAKDRTFTKVIYVFPTIELSQQYASLIMAAFTGMEDSVEILPPPDAVGIARVRANPTFAISLTQKDTATHTIDRPPIIHPGLIAERAVIETDAPNSSNVVSGTLDLGIDMGGGVTGSKISKPITGENGAGRIENKLPGLEVPGLEQILGAVETEAKLTNEGVEATIQVKADPDSVSAFKITDSTLTAKYGASGGLTVEGTIGVAHASGKVSGSVTASYAAGQWRFEGTAKVSDGIVPGLSGFTANVTYDAGKWSFGVDQVSYERELGAVLLKGTAYGLEYDVDQGEFGALLMLEADLGMFGKASAEGELEQNELKRLELSYDSPELKYPKDSDTPSFRGTLGGTISYEDGQLAGEIRGTAHLDIPALQAIAGEAGVGLEVDARINADGAYSGTIALAGDTPLKLGKHLEVPSLSCTIGEDGALSGAFAIKVVKIKHLEEAQIECTVDATGVQIADASFEVEFGEPGQGKFWGTLSAGYSQEGGLSIGGEVNYQIKEGMIATGTLTYASDTGEVSLAMTVDEITLLDSEVSKKLFDVTRQIPVMTTGPIGIYLDLGFQLEFQYGLDLGVSPTVELEGLSLEDFTFDRIEASLELVGDGISAELTGTPRLGLGVFALSPSILRGGGGLTIPIVGKASISPAGTALSLQYTPDGGVSGESTSIGMAMTFGITGSVTPYAELSVLDGLFNPSWEGDPLASFVILPPREIFRFTLDLGGDMSQREPVLPESNPTGEPAALEAGTVLPEEHEEAIPRSGPEASVETEGPTEPVTTSGEEGPFSLATLGDQLATLPGAASIKSILEKAGQAWDALGDLAGRVMAAFRTFFTTLADRTMEILDGFAAQGLDYLPTLVRMIVGDEIYEWIEPAVKGSGAVLLVLFETNPPTDLADLLPWAMEIVANAMFGDDALLEQAAELLGEAGAALLEAGGDLVEGGVDLIEKGGGAVIGAGKSILGIGGD